MMQEELMDKEYDLRQQVAEMRSKLTSLQARRTALKETLQSLMFDIEKFKMGCAPGQDIEDLKELWSELWAEYTNTSKEIGTLQRREHEIARSHHNFAAALNWFKIPEHIGH